MTASPGHRRPRRRRRCESFRSPARRAVAALLLALAVSATRAEADGGSSGVVGPTRVVLISLDGVRHDAVGSAALPGLDALRRGGAAAERLLPVFPSNTFPNHATLATGAWPERHGIVGNRFLDRHRGLYDYDADPSWLEAEPLWAAAERQGVPAAVFFWVASEAAWPGQARPHRFRAPFSSEVGEAEKVEQILAWLEESCPRAPRLILSWWHGADHAAHRFGPESPEALAALRGQDAELARLLRALEARGHLRNTALLVVSDHGMTELRGTVDVESRLADAGYPARVIPAGGTAFVYLARGSASDEEPDSAEGAGSGVGRRAGSAPPRPGAEAPLARARRAAHVLDALPGVRAWATADLPAELHLRRPDRVGDVVAVAEPPLRFAPAGALARLGRALRPLRGGHGYLPDHPDMAGIFLARGAGVPSGLQLGAVRAVDVAPTVAALLCIDPPRDAQGRAIPELVPRDCRRPASAPGIPPGEMPLR